jgi:hypothetical protein
MAIPATSDYAPFYWTYVRLVEEDDLVKAMQSSLEEITENLALITADKADHAYAEGKWTLKELLQHMIDTERVFSYRALAFARGEQQEPCRNERGIIVPAQSCLFHVQGIYRRRLAQIRYGK